jgi:hypothetical protein
MACKTTLGGRVKTSNLPSFFREDSSLYNILMVFETTQLMVTMLKKRKQEIRPKQEEKN